ncbi:MAG: hypothetical protein MR386_08515, partial [Prevotella sp.]|nr:hypothetical protein [Prevotella sp.]
KKSDDISILLTYWLLVVACLENKISTSQLSQAINSPSVPTAVGKCKISMFNIVFLLFSGLVIMLNV